MEEALRIQIEKVYVMYIRLLIEDSISEQKGAVNELNRVLDACTTEGRCFLSTKAIHAAQTIIWQKVIMLDSASQVSWLALLMHPAFAQANQANNTRATR
jgi:hypothetical protein